MTKIIEYSGVKFWVSFCYPKNLAGTKSPCRALVTPLDENERKITKRQLCGKDSDEPVNRFVSGLDPEDIEQNHIPDVVNQLLGLMQQRGVYTLSDCGKLSQETDLAVIAKAVKDTFFEKYSAKYKWAQSTCYKYRQQYDYMTEALQGIDYRTLTPDTESLIQENICRAALLDTRKDNEWVPGLTPPASAKTRLYLFYRLLELLRNTEDYDIALTPSRYQGKTSRKKLLLARTDHARNLPNDLLQKLCKKDVLDGQIGILADTGLRINEYGGLLFCSIGYTDGSQGRMYFIRVSGQLSRQNTRTEYPKTDPSYRLIPISQELGERLIAERENLELRYGDMSLLLRIGQPEESEYYTDAVTISSHMRQLKEQIPQLLRQPEFLEEMRKNRPYTFDKASQDEYLNNMLTSHALRRYFCTWLYTVSGVETNEIYSLMGHLNKNIRQRSGPCGPTPAEIYRLCLLKHVSRTLFHAAHPLQYNLGEKCRETEVPACSVEFTIPPETSWEIVVEDSEPFNHVALRGNGITWDVRYQDEFRPNPNRYALLATEEMYTFQSKGKFLDVLKKATKGEKLNK